MDLVMRKRGSVSGQGPHRWAQRLAGAGSRPEEGVTDAERPAREGASMLVPDGD